MQKFTFGVPEEHVPSRYCPTFSYTPSPVSFDPTAVIAKKTARGFRLLIPMDPAEQIYGLGLQLKGFNHRGKKLALRVNADPVKYTGDSHAPVPFYVSTGKSGGKCYGVYVDTARYAEFYCGKKMVGSTGNKSDVDSAGEIATTTDELYRTRELSDGIYMVIDIPASSGVDLYVMEGSTITDVVAQYNMLAGGGCALSYGGVPDWALGVYYRCCTRYSEDKVLAMAEYFREKDIPCDVIGLEPGWQSHAYSCTFSWNKTLYPHPAETVKKLLDMGYHVNLWEHAYTHPDSPIYDEMKSHCGDFEVWGGVVPDFSFSETRKAFADHHKKEVVSLGIDGFKLDECDNSDYTGSWCFPNCSEFPSGMDGEQYHSLFGTLYMQAVLEAIGSQGTVGQVRNAGALASPYPFVLYSDLYDHRDFIHGVVNAGFSGLMWTPELRRTESRLDLIRRLQTTVFSPQCLLNIWYTEDAPWLELGCEAEVRELCRLRKSLFPRLRKAYDRYRTEGIAVCRALVSDYSSDPETYNIDDEYMFCEDLLVAPMTAEQEEREVYLPAGEWEDFYTGEPVSAGNHVYRGESIPVYRKIR